MMPVFSRNALFVSDLLDNQCHLNSQFLISSSTLHSEQFLFVKVLLQIEFDFLSFFSSLPLHPLFSLFCVTCPTHSPGSTQPHTPDHLQLRLASRVYTQPLNACRQFVCCTVAAANQAIVFFLCVVRTLNLCYLLYSCFSFFTLLAVGFFFTAAWTLFYLRLFPCLIFPACTE